MVSLSNASRIVSLIGALLFDRSARAQAAKALEAYRQMPPAECSFCGYMGLFLSHGRKPRPGARCPSCQSVERHRLLALATDRGVIEFAGKKILHFAPEGAISELVKRTAPSVYQSADIEPGRADLVLNIESIEVPSDSYDLIICSHVLEHVDDERALSEMFRILTPGGRLVAMVPVVEGWSRTYEDAAQKTAHDRLRHFGHPDHKRYYGADFRDRVRRAGFLLSEFTAEGADSVRFRLCPGEKIFIGDKPATAQA